MLVLCFAVFLGSPLSLRDVRDVSTPRTVSDVAVPHLDTLPDVTVLDSDGKRLEEKAAVTDAYSTPTCKYSVVSHR